MKIDNPSPTQLAAYFAALDKRAASSNNFDDYQRVLFLDLGTRIVKVVSYSKAFTSHIEKQLSYVIRSNSSHYDATIVIWQDNDFATLARTLEPTCAPPVLKERLIKLTGGTVYYDKSLLVFDDAYSQWNPLISIDGVNGVANAHDKTSSTYYHCAENLAPEEYIKQGHIFVQSFNKILKSPSSGLVHGAAIGVDGNGILLCARGQRGKSTLAVRAMLDGFDYVSDDYLILGKENDGLYAWPIYSIITLAPMMYNDLYQTLDVKFVSNNSRKDKYVFNIEKYHNRFVSRYPIKMCMIPQIVTAPEPSIVACSQVGKGRAITQLVHSTIVQMCDKHDTTTVKKIIDLVHHLPFYQINLCRDIDKNLHCLRDFLHNGKCAEQQNDFAMLSSYAVSQGIFGKS